MNKERQSYAYNNETVREKVVISGFFWEIFQVVLIALVVIVPIRTFLFQPFTVKGESMLPNFHDGEYLIVNQMGYKQTNVGLGSFTLFTVEPSKEFERGDIVVFHSPTVDRDFYIKRIVGLPGETVEVSNNKVIINNEQYPEGMILDETPYLPGSIRTDDRPPVALGPDEYYVMGDNRANSYDSRVWGALNKDKVMGKVVFRAWPLSESGTL
jgi:signal peptidase I